MKTFALALRSIARVWLVAGAALCGGAALAATLSPEEAVAAVQRGGFVIYFRHGETGAAGSDRERAVMGDCATQRNLDDTGKRQVAQLGQDFKALRIPVGKVLSSEFCRCWQHAQAMFGKGGYTVTPALSVPASYPGTTEDDRQQSNRDLRALLSQTPAAGSNTVLVSHGINVLLLTGYHPGVQGEAVIFKPDGRGGFERVASVLPQQWRPPR